jgi:hypothetical protein
MDQLKEIDFEKIYESFCNYYMDDGSNDNFLKSECVKSLYILMLEKQRDLLSDIELLFIERRTAYPEYILKEQIKKLSEQIENLKNG